MPAATLRPAASESGLFVLEAVNLQLGPNRILIPDLVIVGGIDFDRVAVDPGAVRLVCEIVSPSSSAHDNVLTMHFYATAGIPWYLIVEPGPGTLRLFELIGTTYKAHSTTGAGEILRLAARVTADLDPVTLQPA